jgi:hypothetical protein
MIFLQRIHRFSCSAASIRLVLSRFRQTKLIMCSLNNSKCLHFKNSSNSLHYICSFSRIRRYLRASSIDSFSIKSNINPAASLLRLFIVVNLSTSDLLKNCLIVLRLRGYLLVVSRNTFRIFIMWHGYLKSNDIQFLEAADRSSHTLKFDHVYSFSSRLIFYLVWLLFP